MQKTNIEYLTHTWNPIAMRCTRVSSGCDSCWHLRMAVRLEGAFRKKYSYNIDHVNDHHKYRRKLAAYSGGLPYLDPDELTAPFKLRNPARIGVNFMGDLFHDSVTNEHIAAVFGVMAALPRHTFFILTKRERMAKWFKNVPDATHFAKGISAPHEAMSCTQIMIQTAELVGDGPIHRRVNSWSTQIRTLPWPLPNVWLGVSVEDQETHNDRWYDIADVPAAKKFISYEPALAPLEINTFHPPDLVIAGAETGPGARPCDPDWLRSIRDQCAAAKVPFFLKQIAPGVRELDGRLHEEMP